MSIDKKLLKRLRILYVEDDDVVRSELENLLVGFFDKVFTAKDGQEGLDTYLSNQNEIDIILTDINMPKLSGIDMVKKIREISPKIPVFLATAHSDIELLAEAIKLKVQEYIIKPVDVRHLLSLMNELANVLYQDSLLEQQTKELEQYKEIIDSNNIVLKTDIKMNITYVNELFCQITGYDKEELIGKEFKSLKHPDSSNDIYTKMYASVLNGKSWHGVLKNSTKEHGNFTTDAYVITTFDDSGEITGAISIQRDITDELNKKRDIQLALMKDKSDIFIRSKEGSAEQSAIINELRNQLDTVKGTLLKNDKDIERYIYSIEKYTVENRNLRSELATYKKNAETHNISIKLAKENADLKYQLKKHKTKSKEESEKLEKQLKQQKVNCQMDIDDLEEKLRVLTEKYEAVETDDVLVQKLEYWKEKAKAEASRVEQLEKQIIAHGDKNFMSKIFG